MQTGWDHRRVTGRYRRVMRSACNTCYGAIVLRREGGIAVLRLLLVFAVALFALLVGGSASMASGSACDAICLEESVAATVSAALGTLLATGILGSLILAWHALRR